MNARRRRPLAVWHVVGSKQPVDPREELFGVHLAAAKGHRRYRHVVYRRSRRVVMVVMIMVMMIVIVVIMMMVSCTIFHVI